MGRTIPLYSVHPSVAMVRKWTAGLKDSTGRSLDDWLACIRKDGPATEKQRREWLKQAHGLGALAAARLAERAAGKGDEFDSPDAYLRAAASWVDAMYAGPKAALRPLHDALLALGLSLGPDARACPCQTIVPLYRNHVFAQIKPAARARIDLGFALGARQASGRLIDTGGFAKKDRITHQIPISSLDDIDAEVKLWLRTAYQEDQ
ncbi:MAG: DUF4287 domain-containing protein [Acidobacteriota bacterium]|nr:DUF4287 domain-containing protein [Acidobacteriota bacterium]